MPSPSCRNRQSTGTRTSGNSWSYRNGEFRPNPHQFSATLQNEGHFRYNPFRSLETNFNITVKRDAAIPHEWHGTADLGCQPLKAAAETSAAA